MADYTPLEAPVHDPQALPAHVPSKLFGRDALLAKVYSDLKNDDAVLLYGAAGIGKTALAATLASAYSELPGGVVWLTVDGASLAELIVRVARAYGRSDIANSDNPVSRTEAVRELLSDEKPLLVLDGAPAPQATADFIARCADENPVLITSDEPMEGDWTAIELTPLDADQSNAMLRHLAGVDNGAPSMDLAIALSGSPFAITIAAGAIKANKQSPADFHASMPKAPAGAAPPVDLLALTAAFRSLPSALQGLILMLGATFNGQGSGELLSMISSAPVEGVNQALGMLVGRNLIERITRGGAPYYRMHPLVKDFSESWLRGSNRLEGLQAKVRDSVVAYASRYSTQPQKLAVEIDTFVATSRATTDAGDTDTANQLAVALMQAGSFVSDGGYTLELASLRRSTAKPAGSGAFPAYQGATAPTPVLPTADTTVDDFDEDIDDEFDDDFEEEPFAEAELDETDEDEFDDELDDDELEDDLPIARPSVLPPMDAPAAEMGEMARLRAALMQARQQSDQRRQAETLKAIAALHLRDGQANEAISSYSEALTQFEAVNDRGEMLSVLQSLTELEMLTDNLPAAALHAARAASIADQLGELGKQAQLLSLLGDARQQLGESEPAIRAYTQALELVRAANDARNEAVLLFKLGYAQLDNNDARTAADTWETALKMFKEQERRDYEGRVLGGLGTAYGDMARWTESINFHTSALYIAREVGDEQEEALQLTNLGFASVQANQLGQAVLRYRQALHLAYESDEREDVVSTTVELANVLVASPRHLLIAGLLVEEALKLDPNDRDLRKLKERIETDLLDAEARGVTFIEVAGTAQEYAENAYALLDEA
ncbi:MAG: NB-ARC domain-containing protein [Chloroflexota bacterium]|nr:NB-ARC domain-containing protein [Chloroflexota bacterium]